MNTPFLVAGGLTVLIALAHSYLGERFLISRLLRRPNLPQLLGSDAFTRQVLRFAWHLTTVAWLGSAVIFLALAPGPLDGTAVLVARVLAMVFLVSGVIALIASRGRHLSWAVFLAIALAAWSGTQG